MVGGLDVEIYNRKPDNADPQGYPHEDNFQARTEGLTAIKRLISISSTTHTPVINSKRGHIRSSGSTRHKVV